MVCVLSGLSNLLLMVILFIGRAFGLSANSTNFINNIKVYNASLIFLSCIVTVDFTMEIIYEYSTGKSSLILLTNKYLQLILLFKEILRRLLWLYHQRKLVTLLGVLQELKAGNNPAVLPKTQRQAQHHASTTGSLIWMTILSMLCGLSIFPANWLNLSLHFETYFFPLYIGQTFYVCAVVFRFGTTMFCKYMVPLLGVELASVYDTEVSGFLNYCTLTETTPPNKLLAKKAQKSSGTYVPVKKDESGPEIPQMSFYDTFKTRFQKLQQCFELYNDIFGEQMVLASLNSLVQIVFFVNRIIVTARSKQAATIELLLLAISAIQEILTIWLHGQIGEIIKQKMKLAKEKIHDLNLELSWFQQNNATGPALVNLAAVDEKMRMSNVILDWKWKLTACGLFKVDHHYMLAVGGSVLSLLIFILTVKLP